MERISLHIIIAIFMLFSENIFANQSRESIIPSDSTVKILKITRSKKKKVTYLVPGMKVTYWHKDDKSFWRKRLGKGGIINEIKEDSLVINHQSMAISDIMKIKGKNHKFARFAAKFMLTILPILILIGVMTFGVAGPFGYVFGGATLIGSLIIASLFKGESKRISLDKQSELIDIPLSRSQKILTKSNPPIKKIGRFLANLLLFILISCFAGFLTWALLESR